MPIEGREWYRQHHKELLKKAKDIWVGEGYDPEQERCSKCGKIFPNKDVLIGHQLLEHEQKEVQNDKKKTTGILRKLYGFFFQRV